jgi:NtrC-family two-component system response regulator AlgB
MMTGIMHVLLIDDDASLRRALRTALEAMQHATADVGSGPAALDAVRGRRFDLAFLDLRLGREKGLDLLPELLRVAPGLGVVLMTAFASIDTAVEAMRRGAFDYLPKPFTPNQLRVVLDRWHLVSGLRAEVADLRARVGEAAPDADLSTEEPAMRAALDVAFRVAPTDATVLLRGENGTGKGVLARAVHARSRRAGRPFVTVHCPSLSAELLESDLFGHAKGAFTGAVTETDGKVSAAEGGTLFLDEVGELPPAVQPKLLRFLQERAYERVGETQTRQGDVRLIAASNRDLAAEVHGGRFREDLFYRLNVIEVALPPLRERWRDILTLADRLLTFFARQTAKAATGFTPEARAALERHAWPGNVRELRNVVERGVILAAGPEVGLADLPAQLGTPPAKRVEIGGAATLDEIEAEHVRRVLASAPTLDDAARTLGIDPSTLYRKRKRYGL